MKSLIMIFTLSTVNAFAGNAVGTMGNMGELRPSTEQDGGSTMGTAKFWKVVSTSDHNESVKFAVAQLVNGKWKVTTKSVEAAKIQNAALLRIQSGDQSVFQWNKSK